MGQPFLLGRCFGRCLGLGDARGVRLLFFELLECARGLFSLPLRFRFGGGGGLRLPLGLLFGASRLGRLRLSLGLARRRLLGQACVEINQ